MHTIFFRAALATLLCAVQAVTALSQDDSLDLDDDLGVQPAIATTSFEDNASPMMHRYSPAAGFTIGVGGSFSSVQFEQQLDASGISNVYSGSTLVAFGEAGGPSNPFHASETTLAPTLQLGYLREGSSSGWLWGAKGSYKYLGTTFTDPDINSPQFGSFTNTTAAPADTTFTGHVVIGASQTSIDHQLSLMPFLGHSFERGCIYFGAGPVVFGTETNIYEAVGFANINGVHYDITGQPINFSDSPWL